MKDLETRLEIWILIAFSSWMIDDTNQRLTPRKVSHKPWTKHQWWLPRRITVLPVRTSVWGSQSSPLLDHGYMEQDYLSMQYHLTTFLPAYRSSLITEKLRSRCNG